MAKKSQIDILPPNPFLFGTSVAAVVTVVTVTSSVVRPADTQEPESQCWAGPHTVPCSAAALGDLGWTRRYVDK